jgi:UDPglucose--hexose-1-phosphate uridylyltransferase
MVLPRAHRASLVEMEDAELGSLAGALRELTACYDALFSAPMPYMMIFHQAPTDGRPWPQAHFHVELHPLLRDAGKLKYRAGVESGAGSFINDSLPEEKAPELRAALAKVRAG